MAEQKSDLSRAFSEDGALKTHVGGQALIEGIMMRGKYNWSVAVREPAGGIYVEEHDLASGRAKNGWLHWPLVRGEVAAAHDGGEHAAHALLGHGLHELGGAHGRVAQARRRGDRALGVGRVVQQFDLHKMNAPRFGINSADRAHRGVSFR